MVFPGGMSRSNVGLQKRWLERNSSKNIARAKKNERLIDVGFYLLYIRILVWGDQPHGCSS